MLGGAIARREKFSGPTGRKYITVCIFLDVPERNYTQRILLQLGFKPPVMQSEHFRVAPFFNCELEKLSEIFSTWQLLHGGIYLFILLYILLVLTEQCFEPLRFLALIINRLKFIFLCAFNYILFPCSHIYLFISQCYAIRNSIHSY
jgi:hypothetical protein